MRPDYLELNLEPNFKPSFEPNLESNLKTTFDRKNFVSIANISINYIMVLIVYFMQLNIELESKSLLATKLQLGLLFF